MSWRKPVLALVWAAALAVWAGVAAFYFTEPSLKAWALAVAAGAVVTEIAFWGTAAILGVSIWRSRRTVLKWLARPFRRG